MGFVLDADASLEANLLQGAQDAHDVERTFPEDEVFVAAM
jgi:hypothetical protein